MAVMAVMASLQATRMQGGTSCICLTCCLWGARSGAALDSRLSLGTARALPQRHRGSDGLHAPRRQRFRNGLHQLPSQRHALPQHLQK